jgi:hypothetical protein
MRLARVRFTVRRLIVAVAIAGVVLGGAAWCTRMYRLSRYYLGRAGYYEIRYDANPKNPSARVRDWEYRMMMKYQRLAMFPWGAVEPDPPEPK